MTDHRPFPLKTMWSPLSIERSSGPPPRAINNDWFLWKDFWYNDFLDVDGFIYLFIFLIFLRQAQYVFIHDALVEYVTCGSTEFAVRDLPENLRGSSDRSGDAVRCEQFLESTRLLKSVFLWGFDVSPFRRQHSSFWS